MNEPYCLAMIICDAVHKDPATGKSTILGTFSTVASPSFPANFQLTIYFALTDGLGKHDVFIRLVNSSAIHDEESLPVFQLGIPIEFENPLGVVECYVPMMGPIPEAGVYHCELVLGNDDVLMSRRLIAFDTTEKTE